MYGWLQRRALGEIERVDDDAIVTVFRCVILPVWPTGSFYVHRHAGESVSTPIALHRRSVALGYLRITTWFAASIVASAVVFGWRDWGWLWPIASGLAAVAAVLQFASGGIDPDERDRRRLLRRVVGVGAPPEILPADAVERTRAALEARWREGHSIAWFEAIARDDASDLLAALADYSGRPDLAREVRMRADERALN